MASLLLMPVYTTYLSPEDYGILNTLTSFSAAFPLVISLAIDSSFSIYYFKEKSVSHQNVKILYSTLFWFIVIWGGLFTILLLLFTPYLINKMINVQYWPFIPLTIIPMLFSQISILGITYVQSNLLTRKYTLISLTNFFFSTAIVVLLLVKYQFGIKANLYGAFLGSIFTFIVYVVISVKCSILGFHFDFKILKRSLIFSIPLIPGLAGSWITSLSDRLILSYYGRLIEVGLYSISSLIAQSLLFANEAIMQVFRPLNISSLTEDREFGKKQASEFLCVYIWCMTLAFLLLTFFSKEILLIFANERYHSAYKIVGILAFTYVLGGLYRPFSNIISFNEKNWLLTSASILSAVANGILNFIFIPYFGQFAAALSTLVSVFLYTYWVIFWCQKIDTIKINWKLIIHIIVILTLLLTLQSFIEKTNINTIYKFVLKSLLIIFYILFKMPNNINSKIMKNVLLHTINTVRFKQ